MESFGKVYWLVLWIPQALTTLGRLEIFNANATDETKICQCVPFVRTVLVFSLVRKSPEGAFSILILVQLHTCRNPHDNSLARLRLIIRFCPGYNPRKILWAVRLKIFRFGQNFSQQTIRTCKMLVMSGNLSIIWNVCSYDFHELRL